MFDYDHMPGVPAPGAGPTVDHGPAGPTDEELSALMENFRPYPRGDVPAVDVPSGFGTLELDLATGDPGRLTDAQLIDTIVGFDRIGSWAAARQYRLMAEFARRRPGDDARSAQSDRTSMTSRWAPDEVGLALHLSRGAAIARLRHATQLAGRPAGDAAADITNGLAGSLADTLTLLDRGDIDPGKARLVCDTVSALSAEKATAVQKRVLPRAPGQTWSQLKQSLRRAVLAIDSDGAAERHRAARRERRVSVLEKDDGMATLWAQLTLPDAAASFEWLTRLARGMNGDDPRGMDARRADLMVAALTGTLTIVAPHAGAPAQPGESVPLAQPHGAGGPGQARGPDSINGRTAIRTTPVTPGKPLITVVVPLTTLTGASDLPGEISGYGPVPADLARDIATDAVWKRLVSDPLSGAVLDYGRTTYHPPAALADHVRARDQHCRKPTCLKAAAGCELDHAIPWAQQGTTSDHNLWAGCTRDHDLKEQPGWHVTLHPDGRMEWITPTGHRYDSEPWDFRDLLAPSASPQARAKNSPPEPGGDPPPF